MITKRSEAKQTLERYSALFEKIINKPVTITFDRHKFENVIVTGLQIAKTTGMKNAPDKRSDGEKNRSPMIFELSTQYGQLQFTFDDTTVTALTNGVRLIVGKQEVDLRME